MNQFVILSFGVDPLNWPSFIEIGEIACSTPAWCTRGLTLNPTIKKGLVYKEALLLRRWGLLGYNHLTMWPCWWTK